MPGATEFARIPLRPSSLAMALHSTSIPALGTADSASPGGKWYGAKETTLTRLPPPCWRNTGSIALTSRVKPFNSMSNTSSHWSSSISATKGCSMRAPLANTTAPSCGLSFCACEMPFAMESALRISTAQKALLVRVESASFSARALSSLRL